MDPDLIDGAPWSLRSWRRFREIPVIAQVCIWALVVGVPIAAIIVPGNAAEESDFQQTCDTYFADRIEHSALDDEFWMTLQRCARDGRLPAGRNDPADYESLSATTTLALTTTSPPSCSEATDKGIAQVKGFMDMVATDPSSATKAASDQMAAVGTMIGTACDEEGFPSAMSRFIVEVNDGLDARPAVARGAGLPLIKQACDSEVVASFTAEAVKVCAFLTPTTTTTAPPPPTTAPTTTDPSGITLDEFNAIEIGMSYDDVVFIVGGAGELLEESSDGGSTFTIYTWEGGQFGTASVAFLDGIVDSKAQAGL